MTSFKGNCQKNIAFAGQSLNLQKNKDPAGGGREEAPRQDCQVLRKSKVEKIWDKHGAGRHERRRGPFTLLKGGRTRIGSRFMLQGEELLRGGMPLTKKGHE